ncbi:MAG: RNA-splicing ligase RtcB [Chloroflexi bacterium]|nr:RNA-splicing ligase RtcB [Chloroflexota bacterium]
MNQYIEYEAPGGALIKAWVDGVPVESAAMDQLRNVATLPCVHGHVAAMPVAAMPDVHYGIGATVGSVIPTKGAIIPAAVGVDIGCGMIAGRMDLRSEDLPDTLAGVRDAIERAVPAGRTNQGGAGDRGAWAEPPMAVRHAWDTLATRLDHIIEKTPGVRTRGNPVCQLGTLGTGNHFIEVCLDEDGAVWIMLHSGSRGIGNRIGTHFIELARKDAERNDIHLPDRDLAYFREGAEHFDEYVEAVHWAQDFAAENRGLMFEATVAAVSRALGRPVEIREAAVNCHHNYVAREQHFGESLWITRKGAVRAGRGELGIIPGSMGVRSYITRGLGNEESYESSSHGAGRAMSRNAAKKLFSIEDHALATAGVECRKDADVIDETPGAYKDIEAVMAAQRDLVEVVHTLKQVVCVKG